MGRSVSYPSGAIVAFADYSDQECDECEGTGIGPKNDADDDCEYCNGTGYVECVHDWDEEADYQRDYIARLFPSMQPCDKWLGREDHAIAENAFAYFGMSEYCGLVAFWLVSKEHDATGYLEDAQLQPLADRWLAQVERRFRKAFGSLEKLGTMSNGEGVYRRIEA